MLWYNDESTTIFSISPIWMFVLNRTKKEITGGGSEWKCNKLVCHILAVAHVLFNIALESCVVNFSCRLGEPVKKHLTSKRCPLGRTLDESSTTQPDQEMELLLFQQLPILFFLNCWLCETYFVPVINFELQSFRLSFPPSIFLVGGKADFNSQWVKTNIEWTGPQPSHSSAVWLVLKLGTTQCVVLF